MFGLSQRCTLGPLEAFLSITWLQACPEWDSIRPTVHDSWNNVSIQKAIDKTETEGSDRLLLLLLLRLLLQLWLLCVRLASFLRLHITSHLLPSQYLFS